MQAFTIFDWKEIVELFNFFNNKENKKNYNFRSNLKKKILESNYQIILLSLKVSYHTPSMHAHFKYSQFVCYNRDSL